MSTFMLLLGADFEGLIFGQLLGGNGNRLIGGDGNLLVGGNA